MLGRQFSPTGPGSFYVYRDIRYHPAGSAGSDLFLTGSLQSRFFCGAPVHHVSGLPIDPVLAWCSGFRRHRLPRSTLVLLVDFFSEKVCGVRWRSPGLSSAPGSQYHVDPGGGGGGGGAAYYPDGVVVVGGDVELGRCVHCFGPHLRIRKPCVVIARIPGYLTPLLAGYHVGLT